MHIFVSAAHAAWIAGHDSTLHGMVIDTKVLHEGPPHYVIFDGGGFQPIPEYYIDIPTQEIRYAVDRHDLPAFAAGNEVPQIHLESLSMTNKTDKIALTFQFSLGQQVRWAGQRYTIGRRRYEEGEATTVYQYGLFRGRTIDDAFSECYWVYEPDIQPYA